MVCPDIVSLSTTSAEVEGAARRNAIDAAKPDKEERRGVMWVMARVTGSKKTMPPEPETTPTLLHPLSKGGSGRRRAPEQRAPSARGGPADADARARGQDVNRECNATSSATFHIMNP